MKIANTKNISRVEKRKALIKQQIIDSAIKLFAENGYAKTTVDNITTLADIGHGTFYKYFKNKQHFLSELADGLIETIDDYIHPKNKTLNVQERLFFKMKGMLEFYDQHSKILLAIKDAIVLDKQFEEKWTKINDSLFKRVESDIRGSIKKGYCRDINADVVIIAFSCMLEGYANRVMIQPPSSTDIDTVAASLADLIYHGIFNT